MASAPPELPESIVVGQFGGIRNTVSAERLKQGELSAAVNVDIDDAAQLRRRRGYRKLDSAAWHSIQTLGDITIGVRDGTLGLLEQDHAFTPLMPNGPAPVCAARVADTIFFSGETAGKIVDRAVVPWGTQGQDRWLSPVMQPTETLGAVRGRLLSGPPRATQMALYKGRLYLAAGRTLWATELYLYDLVDKTKGFIQFEADITMIAPVSDGLYVGTTAALYFLQGTYSDGLKQQIITSAPVIPGSLVWVPYAKVDPRARSQPFPEGEGPVFMTTAGVVFGGDGGAAFNLTQDHVVFPDAVTAAALYREDQGANSYVAVTDSAGGPSANARIGDYVDAEIVRASQRG